MQYRTTLVIGLFVLFLSQFTHAKLKQKDTLLIKLTGKVIDGQKNTPISSAQISFEKLPYGDDMGLIKVNDAQGACQFYVVNHQSYLIKVSAQGYETLYKVINITSNTQEEEEVFSLQSKGLDYVLTQTKVYFGQGVADIPQTAFGDLDEIVKLLHKFPEVKIMVEGHSDFRGSAKKNWQLSERRADEVREYLINKGIRKKRIQAKAFGGTKPISDDNTEQAKQLNRRVQLSLLE